MKPIEIFETKAYYNKWLNQLTENEKDLVLEMLKEAQQESIPIEPQVKQLLADRPKIITIIGSTRYINEMSLIGWEFEKQGHIVLNPRLLPANYERKLEDDGRHAAESEGVKEIIDKTYLHKVAMADEIFVVNINGYIGESTRNELNHAIKLGKTIRYLEDDSKQSV